MSIHLFKNVGKELKIFHERLKIAFIIMLLALLCLIARLVQLQIYTHEKYVTLAEHNRFDLIPLPPNRGLIYDKNGVLLAKNKPSFSLVLIRAQTKHWQHSLKQLSQFIPLASDVHADLKKQIAHHRAYQPLIVKMGLTESEIARFTVHQHQFPGFHIEAQMLRDYPHIKTFSHALGYLGHLNPEDLNGRDPSNYAADHFIGKRGLEAFYEDKLHGQVGYQMVELNANGQLIRTIKTVKPLPGHDLHLTLDSKLQHAAMRAMKGYHGALVAINPQNGGILAFVSAPGFDPRPFVSGLSLSDFNALKRAVDHPLYNRALYGQYPLASTIKPYLALLGLESKTITPESKIFDPGWYELPHASHRYHDWLKRGHGFIDVYHAIVYSCDTFFYDLSHRLGIDAIYDFLTQFGFGQATGVDLNDEKTGVVPNPDWKMAHFGKPWYPGDTVITGIGQGFVLATPLQMAQAVSVLATQGKQYQPHLLDYLEDAQGVSLRVEPTLARELSLSPSLFTLVQSAMHGVIFDAQGTGYRFGKAPYSVAAKTGTAQVHTMDRSKKNDDSTPYALKDHSLFIAYAPIQDPQIAIAVVVEHAPQASKVARAVLDAALLSSGIN